MPYTARFSLVLALLLSAAAQAQNPSPPAAAADPAPGAASAIVLPTEEQAAEATQAYCASEWPQDPLIQSRCIDQQNMGRAKAQQFAASAPADGGTIWGKCRRDWTSSRGFLDWVMMSRCLNFEVEAYKQ